jgi:hypothetical protein
VQRARFNRRKRKYAWLEHHSRCTVKRGKCKWEQCPGRNREELTDRDRPVRKSYLTHYKCVQCSMKFGKDHYFCNDFSNNDTRNSLFFSRVFARDPLKPQVLNVEYVKPQNFNRWMNERAEPVVTVTVRKLVNRRIFLLCLFLLSVEYS